MFAAKVRDKELDHPFLLTYAIIVAAKWLCFSNTNLHSLIPKWFYFSNTNLHSIIPSPILIWDPDSTFETMCPMYAITNLKRIIGFVEVITIGGDVLASVAFMQQNSHQEQQNDQQEQQQENQQQPHSPETQQKAWKRVAKLKSLTQRVILTQRKKPHGKPNVTCMRT
ncbi:hypothetical protein JHK85_053182 [Glycine max]|nr:hypothetical protein JHK85_053182 [Glycine max]